MKKFLITILFFATGASAQSALSDDACRDRNGMAINSNECIEYRKANKGLSDIDCYRSDECRAEKQRMAEVRRQREIQSQLAEREKEERAEAAANRKAAAATADIKAKCGEDYKAPRIGMALDRLKQCVTTVRLTSQLNRTDGVVSTYQGGGAYFHVMDGRIVGWGR